MSQPAIGTAPTTMLIPPHRTNLHMQLDIAVLSLGHRASVEINLHGATITSWVVEDKQLLFVRFVTNLHEVDTSI